MRKILLAAAASIALLSPAMAGSSTVNKTTSEDTIKVEPGTSPTQTMSEETPTMKGSQDEDEHAATNRMDEAVPPMKPTDEAKSSTEEKSETGTN